jgi:hypothetical protein
LACLVGDKDPIAPKAYATEQSGATFGRAYNSGGFRAGINNACLVVDAGKA